MENTALANKTMYTLYVSLCPKARKWSGPYSYSRSMHRALIWEHGHWSSCM